MASHGMSDYVIPTEKNQDLITKAKTLNHVPWCEEYEKMISGMRMQCYGVPEIEARFLLTLRLCRQYDEAPIPEDATLPGLVQASREKLTAIVGHLGKHSYAVAPFSATMGCNIYIGDNVVINGDFKANDIGLVTIKDRTLIGSNCRIETSNHSTNYLDRRRPDGTGRPVEIGEDCWVGVRVTILPGVTIGKGCILAAGAVVTKDVPPFHLVGGIPAKVIRYLGNPEEASRGGKGNEEGVSGDDGAVGVGKSDSDLPRWLKPALK